jgi:hypothetical protein
MSRIFFAIILTALWKLFHFRKVKMERFPNFLRISVVILRILLIEFIINTVFKV